MNDFKVAVGLEAIDFDALFTLYAQVGLIRGLAQRGDRATIRTAFERSYRVATVWRGSMLIGAGRMLSDGLTYGMIFDIGVLPDFQRQGVGKALIEALTAGQEHLCLHLTSTFGNEGFYQKLGFRRHKTAFARYPHESDYLE